MVPCPGGGMELHTASSEPQREVHGVCKTSWRAVLLRPLFLRCSPKMAGHSALGVLLDCPWQQVKQLPLSSSKQPSCSLDVIFLNPVQSTIHLSVHA